MSLLIDRNRVWTVCHNCFLRRLWGAPVTWKGEKIGIVTGIYGMGIEITEIKRFNELTCKNEKV